MNKFKSILRALKIFDPDNSVSLTSILMMVIIAKLAISPVLDIATLATLFIALMNYNAKKFSNYKIKKFEQSSEDRLKKLEEVTQEKLKRMDDDLKQLISNNELQKLRR